MPNDPQHLHCLSNGPGMVEPSDRTASNRFDVSPHDDGKRMHARQLRRGRDQRYLIRKAVGELSIRNISVNRVKLGAKLHAIGLVALADVDNTNALSVALERHLRQWVDN